MRSKYKKLLIGIFVLLLLGAGVIWYIFTEKFADTAERKADYTVNAMDLLKEFKQNDSLANKKYIEKIITVNGSVSEIAAAAGDTIVNIKMIDTTNGDYIIFAFQQQHLADAKKLKEGEQVSIKGSCSGSNYSSLLELTYISFKRAAVNK